MRLHYRHLVTTTWAILAITALHVHAIEPSVQKLATKNTLPQTALQSSTSVAITDKWIVVGEALNQDKGLNAGAAHVFDAKTGTELRKLTGADTVAGDFFGVACVISGDTAFIGAYGNGGKAYAFNLLTGVQLRKFVCTDLLVTGDLFGFSIAVTSSTVIVGAPGRTAAGIKSGAAYFFDRNTGAQLQRIVPPLAAANDFFGASVAADGGLAVVGAPFANLTFTDDGAAYVYDVATGHVLWTLQGETSAGDGLGRSVAIRGAIICASADGELSATGAVYLFDATTGNQLNHLINPDSLPGDQFGAPLAVSGDQLVVAAEHHAALGAHAGAAYVYDLRSGMQLRKLTANDGQTLDSFGHSLAVSGNSILIGATGDDDAGVDYGASYLFHNIAGLLPLGTLAAKGSFAPAAPQSAFSGITEAVLNKFDDVMFIAPLTGTGTLGGKTKGAWSNYNSDTHLMARLTDSVAPNVKVADVSKLLFNDGLVGFYRARLSGIGITTVNDNVIFMNDGSDFSLVRSEGNDAYGRLATFNEVVQTFDTLKRGIAMTQSYVVGINGVKSTSDTRIESAIIGSLGNAIAEGGASQSTPGVNFGQISGRVAFTGTDYAWSCALQGGVTTQNAAVFKVNAVDVMHPDTLIARKGLPAPDSGAAVFSSFVCESISTQNSVLIRTTLSGPGVTASSNEALYSTGSGSLQFVARENAPAPGLPSPIVFGAFPKVWATGGAKNQVAMQATLRGRGVTTANDQSLWLFQENYAWLMLMREGDPAPGCTDGAKIGTILRIEMEPNAGRYAIIATLVGGTTGKNLALFIGQTNLGDPNVQSGLRLPALMLRKGIAYQSTLGTTSKLKTIAFPCTGNDALGAGNKGLGECLNARGHIALILSFDDLSVVLANGKL